MNGHAFLERMYLRPRTMTKGGGLYLKRRRAISSLIRGPDCSCDQQPLLGERDRIGENFETFWEQYYQGLRAVPFVSIWVKIRHEDDNLCRFMPWSRVHGRCNAHGAITEQDPRTVARRAGHRRDAENQETVLQRIHWLRKEEEFPRESTSPRLRTQRNRATSGFRV